MPGLDTFIVDEHGNRLTLAEQTEAATQAWREATDAIDAAWKLTPDGLIHNQRPPIQRNMHAAQSIAHQMSSFMLHLCSSAKEAIDRNNLAREKNLAWAVATDEEVVDRVLRDKKR